ncbi:MAG: hydrogenase nickel incorporation protein HypB [Acidobacteriia bacterium]|nr:hydrogenase nickel incorporation protein HypB [Terriglobia bacterium]
MTTVTEKIAVEKKVLSENDRVAAGLRERLRKNGVYCINIISSPGAGKTSLLERTLARFRPEERVAVLTGDIATDNDARRMARFGFPVKQICTGGSCHVDAKMVERALDDWDLSTLDLLIIENVGNLVCPASYDLGEDEKVVVLSTTEGDDKPLKYPGTFFRATTLVINKIDLLPYVPFNIEAVRENARKINPNIEILELSCTTGEGLDTWCAWLEKGVLA